MSAAAARRPLRFDANLRWLFTEVPFERRFEAAARAGFTAVELGAPYTHAAPRIRTLLDDAGLTPVLINSPHGPPGSATHNGLACIPGARDEFRRGFDTALEYAHALGSGLVHVLGGVRPPGVPAGRARDEYVRNIAWAAERSAHTGVTLVLEAINQRDAPGFVLTSLEQAAGIVHEIGAGHVGLLFDVYHCQVGQGDVTRRLTRHFPLIRHIQVADAPARTEPGSGELNWDFLFDRAGALGYRGWIGCEYRPATTTETGLTWLNPHLPRPAG